MAIAPGTAPAKPGRRLASTYRGARRMRARAEKLLWRALPRVAHPSGAVLVVVPEVYPSTRVG